MVSHYLRGTTGTLVEFKPLPRGSYRCCHQGMTIDVWKVGGQGWQYTIIDDETGWYRGNGKGFPTIELACEDSLRWFVVPA